MVTIYDNLEILEGVKDDIKIAIEDKGIAVGDTPFIDYANKIAEISVGDGDYADGYTAGVDAGKQIQKSLLTPISIIENGDYSSENGYNNIHVNVPDINGSYEDGYNVGVEDGKTTQKSLMETRTFHRNGTYSREDGYSKVVVNVQPYPNFINNAIDNVFNKSSMKMSDIEAAYDMAGNKSSNGMMYYTYPSPVITLQSYYITSDVLEQRDNLVTFMVGTIGSPNNSLVKPFVYTEGNSIGSSKIIAPYWYGGFNCYNITYIDRVFENAGELEYMEYLSDLGKSFTSICTLDMSNTNLTDEAQRKIGNSIYDFVKYGVNVNGVDYSSVKFNNKASAETKELWMNKGWEEI